MFLITCLILGFFMGVGNVGCAKETSVKPLRWVALGDSLTVGYGVNPQQCYPELVEKLSQGSTKPIKLVKNLANGGHTLAKVQLVQLPLVRLYRPDVVSLWIGTNDALLEAVTGKTQDWLSQEPLPTPPKYFEHRLKAVIEKLRDMKVSTICIATLHDLTLLPITKQWDPEEKAQLQRTVEAYNEIMVRLASQYPNVKVVPLHQLSALQQESTYAADGLHFTPQAYPPIAEAFWKVLFACP